MKYDRIDTALLHISQDAVEQSATKIAPVGSLLMLVRGMGLANGIQVGEVVSPVAFNQDIRAIQPPLTSVLPRFLLLALRNGFINGEGERVLSSAAHGTLKIDADVLRQIAIPLPPLPEQHRIVGILDKAFESIATAEANAEKNIHNARALFTAHLRNVFTNRGRNWVDRRLAEVCELVNGRAYKKEEMLASGKYPLLRVGNFFTNKEWYYSDLELDADKYCDTGDLLYAWSASFGPRIWGGGKVIYHYHIWKVIPRDEDVDKRLLLHLLEWDVDQIKRAHGTGTTMMHVSKGSMESRVVPVPPRDEQARIAARLDELTFAAHHLETIYTRKLAALDELKKALLHRAFTGHL